MVRLGVQNELADRAACWLSQFEQRAQTHRIDGTQRDTTATRRRDRGATARRLGTYPAMICHICHEKHGNINQQFKNVDVPQGKPL